MLGACACAALWSARLPLLLFDHPLRRCRWLSSTGALDVGVAATLLLAASSLLLLRPSTLLLRCPVRRRALAHLRVRSELASALLLRVRV